MSKHVQGRPGIRDAAMMSDAYMHLFKTHSDARYDNLRDLTRYLILNSEKIEAGGSLLFDPGQMLFLDRAP